MQDIEKMLDLNEKFYQRTGMTLFKKSSSNAMKNHFLH